MQINRFYFKISVIITLILGLLGYRLANNISQEIPTSNKPLQSFENINLDDYTIIEDLADDRYEFSIGQYETTFHHLLENKKITMRTIHNEVLLSSDYEDDRIDYDAENKPVFVLAGTHLHFEIRVGRNAYNNDVPPELYLDQDLTTHNADTHEQYLAECSGEGGGGTAEDPWGGMDAHSLGKPNIDIVYKEIVQPPLLRPIKKVTYSSLTPAARITYLDTNLQTNQTVVYGVAPYKHQIADIGIYECRQSNLLCESAFSVGQSTIQFMGEHEIKNAQVRIFKQNEESSIKADLWNDTPDDGRYGYADNRGVTLTSGRWLTNRQLPGDSDPLKVPDQVNYGDTVCPQVSIFENISYDGDSFNLHDLNSGVGGCRKLSFIFGDKQIIRRNGSSREASLHLYSDGGNRNNKNQYDGNSKVWIISHGMNNTYIDMYALAESVKVAEMEKGFDPIIILVDWEGARKNIVSPTQTDQWIRPTAEVLTGLLETWGVRNATEINFAGHSMGTFMINEIAMQLPIDAHGMYFLDPPNFLPGTDFFEVDDRPGAANTVYNESKGYSYHYNRASISRAFTGIKRNGDGNWCGNTRLNRTAKESISVYLADDGDLFAPPVGDCAIHGDAIRAFSRIITDQKVLFDGDNKLNLHASGVENYSDTIFYKDDTDFDASIYAINNNDIQSVMTKKDGADNEFNLWGKHGGSLYANFNYGMHNLKNKAKLNVMTFGDNDNGWDRIHLQNVVTRVVFNKVYIYDSQYVVEDGKIKRRVDCTVDFYPCPGISQFTEFVVSGRRSDDIRQDKLDEDKKSPNETEVFTFR